MQRLVYSDLPMLLAPQSGPCISIYLPVGGGRTALSPKNLTQYRKLLRRAEALLLRRIPADEAQELLAPLRFFSSLDPVRGRVRGLCFFRSSRVQGVFATPHECETLSVVADSFHLRPLLDVLQDARSYLALRLSAGEAWLYCGHGRGLEALFHVSREPKQHLGEFLMQVEREVSAMGAHLAHAPLLTFGDAEVEGVYRLVSAHRHLHSCGPLLSGTPADPDVMLEQVWPHAERLLTQRRQRECEAYVRAMRHGSTLEALPEVTRAADAGLIRTLFVRRDVHLWGRADFTSGAVALEPEGSSLADDVLDDIGERVLRNGGMVIPVEEHELPMRGVAAALLKPASPPAQRPQADRRYLERGEPERLRESSF